MPTQDGVDLLDSYSFMGKGVHKLNACMVVTRKGWHLGHFGNISPCVFSVNAKQQGQLKMMTAASFWAFSSTHLQHFPITSAWLLYHPKAYGSFFVHSECAVIPCCKLTDDAEMGQSLFEKRQQAPLKITNTNYTTVDDHSRWNATLRLPKLCRVYHGLLGFHLVFIFSSLSTSPPLPPSSLSPSLSSCSPL